MTPAIRSLLFVPGSSPRMVEKAKRSGADALILDLEDAVAAHVRAEARATVAAAVAEPAEPVLFVRVNHPGTGEAEADVDAAVAPALAGVVLPKAEHADDVARLDAWLSEREQARGLPAGAVRILPLVESGRGLHFAYELATASPRVPGLAFSSGEEGDFMADIDGEWTPDGAAMAYARGRIVAETRAAGLRWPVDGVFMQLQADQALARECRLARAMGFQAKMAIHPRQLATIHEVFTPSAEEVARQEAAIAAYREAEAAGLGAVQRDGLMIDKANVVRAERILARARPAGQESGT
jgi:citrate lyase subunit beta/citryl-CoA lyase